MNDLTVSGAKALARGMIERMAAVGVPMTLAQALEAVAASHHYQDWNRFRDALKKGRVQAPARNLDPYPPHRLIVTSPGYGSGAVIDHQFLFEARQPGVLPIMVHFWGAPTASYLYNVIVPETGVVVIDANFTEDAKIVFDGSLPSDATGLIISLSAEILQRESAWQALMPLIPALLDRQQMEMPGTLFINDHRLQGEYRTDYDEGLPALMTDLRACGGRKSLVVVTQNDEARCSLYRSPDAWRLIMMAGDDPKLFYRCPFERVVAFPFSMAVQSYYSRLFIDPGRLLEDAALLIGTMTLRHTEHPLPNESVYGRSLINYCRDNIEWTRKRHEERDREEAKLKAFLDGVQGVERTKRSHRELI